MLCQGVAAEEHVFDCGAREVVFADARLLNTVTHEPLRHRPAFGLIIVRHATGHDYQGLGQLVRQFRRLAQALNQEGVHRSIGFQNIAERDDGHGPGESIGFRLRQLVPQRYPRHGIDDREDLFQALSPAGIKLTEREQSSRIICAGIRCPDTLCCVRFRC